MGSDHGAWLDRMYNNRGLVPDYAQHLQRWADTSVAARREHACELDVAYGEGPKEKLDVFPAGEGAPVLVYIHGGYWRALDKSDQSFVGPAFARQGVCVVIPNYELCPATTVPAIVLQMVQAVAWTARNIHRFGGDPSRIVVTGHSAGGHLAAMMAACRWSDVDAGLDPALVKGAISISGVHDLEPIMHTPFLQPDLRLTPEHVALASPARLPAPSHGRLYALAGGDESDEFHRQCQLMQQAWGRERVPVTELVPGMNHFTVLDDFIAPDGRLHQLTLDLVKA